MISQRVIDLRARIYGLHVQHARRLIDGNHENDDIKRKIRELESDIEKLELIEQVMGS